MQRLRQGSRALLAFTQPVDEALVETYLSPEQRRLFRRMRHSEQLHSVSVLQAVLAQEATTPHALAVAALLHDVGKSRYKLMVWQKTIAVLVKKFAPGLFERLNTNEPTHWWQIPFAVRTHHPAWGAAMAAAANTDDVALWLIAHHQDTPAQWRNHPHYALLKRLQLADDAN
ncbi:MAG: HD domain-containing protein [Chloroflexi bacterium]|nr:MAG: HD domain-containing protein [Chloroflexota bacterium]